MCSKQQKMNLLNQNYEKYTTNDLTSVLSCRSASNNSIVSLINANEKGF